MAENKIIIDKITTLRLLHDVRSCMQKFAANQSNPKICQSLIEIYNAFSNDNHLPDKVWEMIASRVSDISFNPYAFKTTSKEEDKSQKKAVKKSANQNKATALLQKQIGEELAFQKQRGKMTDVPSDAVFESVALLDDAFSVKIAGRDEPIQFPVKSYKGKHFSLLGVKALSDKAYAKKGFDDKTYQLLSKLGDKGFVLEEAAEVANVGKKYSPSQYKSYLGLNSKDVLSAEQKKELEILNTLSAPDQANFIVGVKKRKLEQSRHQNFFDALKNEPNLLKLLADREKLAALFTQNNLSDSSAQIQDEFIKTVIQPDKKDVWNYFKKTEDGNSRFSYYDILMNNLVADNRDVFQNIYDFDSPQKMKGNLITAYQKVKKISIPMLPDTLCAEILTRGIFSYAVNQNTNADKLKNMNLLLNEFGLNIKFDTVQVTQVPDMSIASAQQQSKIDREAFEADKRTPLSQAHEKSFRKQLQSLGIEQPDAASKHHFWALKYNPFIDRELNQSSNYVQTVREHPWNLDGHDFTHNFDTAGEFLVMDENQKYSLMDFNSLRRAFNSSKKLFLQIPILQVKNDNNEFCDLLAPSQKQGECGTYISTDKTPSSFIHLPQCCKGLFISKDKSKDIFEKE